MSSFTPPERVPTGGTDPWTRSPDGGAPLLWGCVDHTLTRGQTCYLTTPSLRAYLRLCKREGCIYCMSSFEHISGGVAPCVGGSEGPSDQGFGGSQTLGWGSQTLDLGWSDPRFGGFGPSGGAIPGTPKWGHFGPLFGPLFGPVVGAVEALVVVYV